MPSIRTGDFDCWYADDYFGDAWADPDVIVNYLPYLAEGEDNW